MPWSKTYEWNTVMEREFLTMKFCPKQQLLWNEWRGSTPSLQLREAMIYACNFILENGVELILADYTKMCAPNLEDQVWIANHTARLLQHSKLKRVANILAKDLFQQLAIESIYEKASAVDLPCESRDFIAKEDAMEWLYEEKHKA